MSSQILGILAAASLISTGATATKETRASSSFPTANSGLALGGSKIGAGCLPGGSLGKIALPKKNSPSNKSCGNNLAQAAAIGSTVAVSSTAAVGSTVLVGSLLVTVTAIGIGVVVGTQSP
jgi:hypothetical protein